MKICLLPSDFDGPGCYRLLFPGKELRRRGHEAKVPSHTKKEINGSTKIFFDVSIRPPRPNADIYVLQQQKGREWALGGVRDLRRYGKVVVSEVDDNYLELPEYNPAFLGTHPYRRKDGLILNRDVRRKLKKQVGITTPPNRANRKWMEQVFEQSDALTVSTPYLAEIYSRFNHNIHVIRNYLAWEMWEDVELQYEVERPRLRIGWMGAAEWRGGDLEILKPVVRPFLLKHPEIDFVAAGSPEVHDILGVPEGQRISYPYTHFRDFKLPEITAVMDVGLIPMVLNGLNEGKSHLKGMEYNACGIPFIASPTESYKEYWCDGENGFLASTTSEWLCYLEELVGDGDLRGRMGAHGRAKAATHTIERHAGKWEDLFRGLLGDETTQLARISLHRGAIQKVEELAPFLRLVRERQPEVVCEIGTAQGGTLYGLCQSAHPEATVVSIDLPGADFGGKGVDTYGERNVARMARFGQPEQDLHFLRANSQLDATRVALERILDGRTIQLLFIDGDHAYEGVRRDYELYSPLVDGLVAFHDIVPHPHIPETQVHRFWRELSGEKSEFIVRGDFRMWGEWGGIGVLETNREAVAA